MRTNHDQHARPTGANAWMLGGVTLLLLALLLAPTPARAITPDSAPPQFQNVNAFYGAFTTEVPIAVPPYHGLEPGLKLLYSSTGRNGFVGMGWTLGGLSVVERAAPDRGAPRYDASDIFVMDGQELVPCTSQGGEYCTQIQNYTRIVRGGGNDGWIVWATNGNKATYEPIFQVDTGSGLETFRWLLARTEDPHGNLVQYFYHCTDDGEGNTQDCYIDQILYNGNEIRFRGESRPDDLTFATGATLGKTKRRLRSIDVKVGGDRARVYEINYTQSVVSGRSWVESVQQFGRDAVINGGDVSGPSALPAMTYTAPAGPAPGTYTTFGPQSEYTIPNATGDRNSLKWFAGDPDGDGRTDIMVVHLRHGHKWRISTFTTSDDPGAGNPFTLAYFDTDWDFISEHPNHDWMIGDLNADGRTDVMGARKNGSSVALWTAISNGDGTYSLDEDHVAFDWRDDDPWFAADVNGDGLADFVTPHKLTNGDQSIRTMINLGDGNYSAREDFLDGISWTVDERWFPGDFNGDGLADVLTVRKTGSTVEFRTHRSLGDGQYETTVNPQTNAAWDVDNWWFPADINGDGKTDFALVFHDGTEAALKSFLSFGDGTYEKHRTDPGWDWDQLNQFFAVDSNADGHTDIVQAYPHKSADAASSDPRHWALKTAHGRGDGSFTDFVEFDAGWSRSEQNGEHQMRYQDDWFLPGNFSATGQTDIAHVRYLSDEDTSQWRAYALQVGHTDSGDDLLRETTNGIGGTTTVEYAPSTEWDNQFLPVGMVLQTVRSTTISDGRGPEGTGMTDFSYEGGLWFNEERRFLGFRKVTAVVDPEGNYTETIYHQLQGSVSKPEKTYFFDPNDNIYSFSEYDYNEGENPTQQPYISLLTKRWDYECNGASNEEDCLKVLTQFQYDEYGNPTHMWEYGHYDDENDILGDERTTYKTYSPNTVDYLVSYPAAEAVFQGIHMDVSQAGPPLGLVEFYYDGASQISEHPTVGNVTREATWNDQTAAYVDVYRIYDPVGNITKETDARGYSEQRTFDSVYGVYETGRCRAPETFNYCSSRTWDYTIGRITSETDENQNPTTFNYDAFGRRISAVLSDGTTTQFQFLDYGDPNNQRKREIFPDGSPDGLWMDVYQDGLGRAYKVVNEGGITRETIFHHASTRIWKESQWFLEGETPRYTVNSYDGAMRPTRITHPDSSYAELAYANGLVVKRDELGHEKTTWTDGLGRTIQIKEQNGTEEYFTTFSYDAAGRLLEIVDDDLNTSTTTWDSLGRRIGSCDVDLGCWSYEYDDTGLLTAQVDARGERIELEYDGLGRPTEKRAVSDPGQLTQWFYDEAGHGASIGRLTRSTYPQGSESHSWDVFGQQTETTLCVDSAFGPGQMCKTFSQTYDSMKRPESLTYPNAEQIFYAYNDLGQLESVSGYVNSMEWSPAGKLERIVYANGAESNFDYDADRLWLTDAEVRSAGGDLLYEASYVVDVAARIDSVSSSTNPLFNLNYGYDDLNRLTSVSGGQSQTFSYDALGNMLSQAGVGNYQYNDAAHKHAVSKIGNKSYKYDANGNMTKVLRSTGGCGGMQTLRTYTWNPENTLASVQVGGETYRFAYDPEGQRIRKKHGATQTRYFGSLAERRGAEDVYYYYAGPILVAMQNDDGTSWYHHDHLGSVRLLTDEVGSSDPVASYDYSAFGESLNPPESSPNTLGFGGHQADDETGLVYMNARYYDAELGRFISADTMLPDLEDPQSFNRYSFVLNNPITNVDPTGHLSLSVIIGSVITAIQSAASLAAAAAGAIWEGVVAAAGFVATALKGTAALIGKIATGIKSAVNSLATVGRIIGNGLAKIGAKIKTGAQWLFDHVGTIIEPQSFAPQQGGKDILKEFATEVGKSVVKHVAEKVLKELTGYEISLPLPEGDFGTGFSPVLSLADGAETGAEDARRFLISDETLEMLIKDIEEVSDLALGMLAAGSLLGLALAGIPPLAAIVAGPVILMGTINELAARDALRILRGELRRRDNEAPWGGGRIPPILRQERCRASYCRLGEPIPVPGG